jgi:undecaprenyl-diphosphatase
MDGPSPPPEPVVALRPERAASHTLPWPVLALAAVALLLIGLLGLGHELMGGHGARLDRAIMLALRVPGHPEQPAGPAWLPSAMRDITALGSTTVLTLIVIAASSFLALQRRFRAAALVLAATILGASAVTLVKALVSRARPDIVERLMVETSHSFPSGHSANSAIVYLTLATLLFPVVRERRMRVFLLGVALLLVAMIGVSRVYLGVHWPSDVLAGWAFGSCWALLWWWIELRWFRAKA